MSLTINITPHKTFGIDGSGVISGSIEVNTKNVEIIYSLGGKTIKMIYDKNDFFTALELAKISFERSNYGRPTTQSLPTGQGSSTS